MCKKIDPSSFLIGGDMTSYCDDSPVLWDAACVPVWKT